MKNILTLLVLCLVMLWEGNAQSIETKLAINTNDKTVGGKFWIDIQVKGTGLTTANTLCSSTIDLLIDSTKIYPLKIGTSFTNVQGTYKDTINNNYTRALSWVTSGSYIRLTIADGTINQNGDGTPAGQDIYSTYMTIATVKCSLKVATGTTDVSIMTGSLALSLFTTHNNDAVDFTTTEQTMTAPVNLVSVAVPVELTSFTASANHLNAQLQWSTATEVNNYGFDIERRAVSDKQSAVSSWVKIGFVKGNGTSNVQHSYSFSDKITESGRYAYRLKQIDNGGAFKYSQEAEVTIEVPKVFTLNQNYPNPFNPTTTISFTLAKDGITTLRIFDMLGREVATLANGEMKAGVVQQVTFDASRLSSGIYFSCLENNGQRQIKKIMLMK